VNFELTELRVTESRDFARRFPSRTDDPDTNEYLVARQGRSVFDTFAGSGPSQLREEVVLRRKTPELLETLGEQETSEKVLHDKMAARPTTPASPKHVKLKAPVAGTPLYGCGKMALCVCALLHKTAGSQMWHQSICSGCLARDKTSPTHRSRIIR
jgi:hypothetical protein